MKKYKEYKVENFDHYNIELIKKLVKLLLKEFNDLKIKIFNENDGFYEHVNLYRLERELDKLSKEQSGLDEVILEHGEFSPLGIVIHHELCIVTIDKKLKEKIEKELGIKLEIYQKIRLVIMKLFLLILHYLKKCGHNEEKTVYCGKF